LSSSRISINTFSCSTPFGSLLSRDDDFLTRFHNGAESPMSIRHPGTSKSRDKKNKKRKKGKTTLFNSRGERGPERRMTVQFYPFVESLF
jgi:hypothetical protein